ncbi:MAG TPA: DUF2339 domain-containing protein [Xanthomonadaceae bacterium]|nr:DUF2339 domain-containing protein [Xanthomonadaceae bacterium]
MHWLAGILGAIFGAIFGAAESALLGFLLGFLVGWQGARLAELRRRLGAVERSLASLQVEPARPSPARVEAAHPPPVEAKPEPEAAPPVEAASSLPEPPPVSPAPEPSPTPRPWDEAPAVARSAAVAEPAVPGLEARIGATLKRWLLEGNVPVKLGSLVLFVGVAAALKYASDQGLLRFPIELRLAGIALGALGLLVWGWRRREVQPAFGLSLQGAGLGVLLLTVFAAFRLYQLLPVGPAFVLVLVLVAGATLLAILQNNMALAVLGFIGGYLAPVLISTGSGNHVALFTYYAVLNAAVFAVAWMRPWRALNLVGFAFTFAIMMLWGWNLYRPENFATVEPFLILFFLFFTAIPVLYALRQPPERRGLVDGTLVFGTPLIAFAMQATLLANEPLLLAYSALAVAALYTALAAWLIRSRGILLLGQSFAVLAVGFATLAVPLALSARWTSATWALEGAALVWLGLRQKRLLPQVAGWTLQALAVLAYLGSLIEGSWRVREGEWLLLNGHTLGLLMMAGAGCVIARLYDREVPVRRWLVWPPFLAGLFWWSLAGIREVEERLHGNDVLLGIVALAALTAALAGALRHRLPWPRMGWVVVAAAVLSPLLALGTLKPGQGLLQWPALGVWTLLVSALAFALACLREPRQRWLGGAHTGALWTVSLALGFSLYQEARLNIDWALGSGWRIVALGLPLALLLLATWRKPRWFAWPLSREFPEYAGGWFVSASIALGLLFVQSLGSDGSAAPLPFVPLLNPLELFQLGLLLVFARKALVTRPSGDAQEVLRFVWPAAAFLFLTFAGLRGVHHLTGVAWAPTIVDDAIAQATLTVLWSVAGVTAWVYGSRTQRWPVWLAGAIMMGLVLGKLILVDRQHMGDVAGIVSFMAVGALLVLVGRVAPTPPRSTGDAS